MGYKGIHAEVGCEQRRERWRECEGRPCYTSVMTSQPWGGHLARESSFLGLTAARPVQNIQSVFTSSPSVTTPGGGDPSHCTWCQQDMLAAGGMAVVPVLMGEGPRQCVLEPLGEAPSSPREGPGLASAPSTRASSSDSPSSCRGAHCAAGTQHSEDLGEDRPQGLWVQTGLRHLLAPGPETNVLVAQSSGSLTHRLE